VQVGCAVEIHAVRVGPLAPRWLLDHATLTLVVNGKPALRESLRTLDEGGVEGAYRLRQRVSAPEMVDLVPRVALDAPAPVGGSVEFTLLGVRELPAV
jgi:hypothetical protein